MLRLLFLFILILNSVAAIFCQSNYSDIRTFIDSNITRNFSITTFDNQINSLNLESKINFNQKVKKYNFFIKNYYSSAVTKLTENLFRDFDNVKAGAGYNLFKNLNVSLNYLGFLFSDDKTIQLKGSSSSLFYLSSYYENDYKSAPYYLRANIGYKAENQIGEFNKGINLAGEFNIENLNLSDYIIESNTKLSYENLNPRRNNYIITHLHADKSFSNGLSVNEFDGAASRVKKDFYFPADIYTKSQFGVENNIEKRTESNIKIFDRFDYTISGRIGVYVIFNPYFRNVRKENFYIPNVPGVPPTFYDTEVQETNIGGESAINFDYPRLGILLRGSYSERDEKFFLINPSRIQSSFVKIKEELEATKNNHSTKLKLGANLFYTISKKLRAELSGFGSILKYDTPSINNVDDRDELNIIGYAALKYDSPGRFTVITSGDISLYHTVYILSAKSSNNNWNRIFRITSKSYFTPFQSFKTINTFSILANYTVYDFQNILASVKSFSFRQVNFKDSTTLSITNRIHALLYAEVKLYERGELNWNEFSSRPLNYFEDRNFNPELEVYILKNLMIAAGYKYFEQKRFNYITGEKIFDTSFKTYGPTGRIKIFFPNGSYIEATTSYDHYQSGANINKFGNLYINAVWNL